MAFDQTTRVGKPRRKTKPPSPPHPAPANDGPSQTYRRRSPAQRCAGVRMAPATFVRLVVGWTAAAFVILMLAIAWRLIA